MYLNKLKENRALTESQEKDAENLFDYISSAEGQAPTLREIKRACSSWMSIEKDIDCFIKNGWINRINGRYQITKNVMTKEEVERYIVRSKEQVERIASKLTCKSVEEQIFLLSCLIKEVKKENAAADYGLADNVFDDNLVTMNTIETETYAFLSMTCDPQQEHVDVAAYLCEQNKKQKYPKLYSILGDANPYFVADMLGKTLSLIEGGEGKRLKNNNIFLTFLYELNEIKQTEENIHLVVPITQMSQEKRNELQKEAQQMMKDLYLRYDSLEEEKWQTFFLEQSLLHHQWDEREIHRYVYQFNGK